MEKIYKNRKKKKQISPDIRMVYFQYPISRIPNPQPINPQSPIPIIRWSFFLNQENNSTI